MAALEEITVGQKAAEEELATGADGMDRTEVEGAGVADAMTNAVMPVSGEQGLLLGQRSSADSHQSSAIFVLNKVDLVPTWVTQRWVAVLSQEVGVIAIG